MVFNVLTNAIVCINCLMKLQPDFLDINTLGTQDLLCIIIFIIYLLTGGVPAHELQLNNIVLLGQAVLPSRVI